MEQDIQTRIIEYWKSKGAKVNKINSASSAGISDLLICYRGRYIALEVKDANGQLSDLQKYHIRKTIEAGGIAFGTSKLSEVQAVALLLDENPKASMEQLNEEIGFTLSWDYQKSFIY